MFKKRDLLTLVVLLLAITAIAPFELERYRIVAVCRDALVFETIVSKDLKYESIVFHLWEDHASVSFSYREDEAYCNVRRNGLGWDVSGAGYLMLSSTP